MKQKFDQPRAESGLIANGSCRKWDIAVDETFDGDKWSLELDGPLAYLVFQLRDLRVIPEAVRFLQSGSGSNQSKNRHGKREGWSSARPVRLCICFPDVGQRRLPQVFSYYWPEGKIDAPSES
jgi:hypothetical protein